jgi:hypothetical protein
MLRVAVTTFERDFYLIWWQLILVETGKSGPFIQDQFTFSKIKSVSKMEFASLQRGAKTC